MTSQRKVVPLNNSCDSNERGGPSPFSVALFHKSTSSTINDASSPPPTTTTATSALNHHSTDSNRLPKVGSFTSSNQRYKRIVESIGKSLGSDYKPVCPPELGLFSTRFETLEVIARGSFGSVKKCADLLNDRYRACKKVYCLPPEPFSTPTTMSTEDVSLTLHTDEISPSSTIFISNPISGSLRRDYRSSKGKLTIENVYNEIFILHQVHHPNIVRLFSYYDDYRNNLFYLIFEYSCMGPIIDVPTDEGLSEYLIRTYLRDIICAVDYIHSQNIAHCDIKPSNALVFEKHVVKLCDFGSSIISSKIRCFPITNFNRPKTSLAFQSPEYLSCESGAIVDLTCCDVWSIGVTAFCMITGNIPWSSHSIGTLFNDIEKSPAKFPTDGNYVNPCLEEIVHRMLAKKPDERITIDTVKQNPWLTLGGRWPFI